MVDQLSRTVHQGFFSRIASSFMGVLIGFLMVPASVLLIGWNEYRTVHRSRALTEAEQVVVSVPDPMEIDPKFNGRLVHMSGLATTDESLADPAFSISQIALRLRRQVEMYQWVETKESKTRDKLGGGRETITTYKYDRKWASNRVDSDHFEERTGHVNPVPRYLSEAWSAQKAMVGAYHLRQALVEEVDAWKEIPIELAALVQNKDEEARKKFSVDGDRLFYSEAKADPNAPQVGDLRIRFQWVPPTQVSLLSGQKESDLEPFRTSNGETVESLAVGNLSSADLINGLKQSNTMMAMLFRGLGWILACVGFGLIVGPLKALANVIPMLGQMVGIATGAIAFILGSVVALTVIATAWIAVRPIYAIVLLVLAAFGLYILFRKRKPAEIPMAVLVE